MHILKKIVSISLYNSGISLLNLITLLIAVTGTFFTLQSTSIIPNNIEFTTKIFKTISLGALSWFSAVAFITTILDILTNTNHLDRLLHNIAYYKYKVTTNVNYSRFTTIKDRIVTGLVSVFPLTCIIGYYGEYFALSKEEISYLLSILSTAILSGGMVYKLIAIPASFIQRKTDSYKINEEQKLFGLLQHYINSQPYESAQEIIARLSQPRIESHPPAIAVQPFLPHTTDTAPIVAGPAAPTWTGPQTAPVMLTSYLVPRHRLMP